MTEYHTKLTEYAVLFVEKLSEDAQVIDNISSKFSRLDKDENRDVILAGFGSDIFNELKNQDPALKHAIMGSAINQSPEFKFNMMTAFHMSKMFMGSELRILSIFELLTMRSVAMSKGTNEHISFRTWIAKTLEMPTDEIPRQIMVSASANDEMLAATAFIEAEIDMLDGADSFMSVESFREYAKTKADTIIAKANAESYFGTYPAYIFAEVIMLRKMTVTNFPVYSTSSFPKMELPYDQLIEMVKTIWSKTHD